MRLPKIWCTKDPRPCAKYIAIIEMILSILGAICLLALPFLVLSFDDEVEAIRYSYQVIKENTHKLNYSLETADFFKANCTFVRDTIIESLDYYLLDYTGESDDKAYYLVSIKKYEKISQFPEIFSCKIDVKSSHAPCTDIVAKRVDKKLTFANIVSETIIDHDLLLFPLTYDQLEEKMKQTEIDANDLTDDNTRYILSLTNNDEKYFCIINNTDVSSAEDHQHEYDTVFNLLISVEVFSVMASLLVLLTVYIVSKYLILVALIFQLICAALLLAVVIIVTQPSLCMLEYGGVTSQSATSPKHLQTGISTACLIDILVLRGYTVCFLAVYAFRSEGVRLASFYSTVTKSTRFTEYDTESIIAARKKVIHKQVNHETPDETPDTSDTNHIWKSAVVAKLHSEKIATAHNLKKSPQGRVTIHHQIRPELHHPGKVKKINK